ncbi:acyltransferase family protein [Kitasatospora sp. NPDC090308]|uniref:acyltransferase family protein n=1 Tax=Kitasatospora sp. NPDC090308 TaxID=3364082 RepID=UPI0038173AD4
MELLLRRSGGDPPREPRSRGRLAALDGLRLVAALMVLFHHYVGYGGGTKPAESAWERPAVEVFHGYAELGAYTWTGVCLFFVISGFVICMSSWGRSLGDFVRSRVVRLYPAYWFAVLTTTAFLALWPTLRKPLTVDAVLANLTMFHLGLNLDSVDAVYWTLWVEMRFYLLFAPLVWRGLTYRKIVVFCVLWTVASAWSTPLVDSIGMSEYSSFFVAGMAMYLMHRFGPNLLLWGIVGFNWALSVENGLRHQAEVQPSLGDARVAPLDVAGLHLEHWPVVLLVTLAYLAVLAVALGWTARIQWRWLTVAGALTYPLYLLHEVMGWTALRWLHRSGMGPWPAVGTVTAAMLVVAWLVHRLVERPLAPVLRRGLDRALEQVRAADPPGRRSPAGPAGAAAPVLVEPEFRAPLPQERSPV